MARLVGALGSTRQGVHANALARASGQAHIGQQAGKFCRRNKAYHALQFAAIRGQDENAGRAIRTKRLSSAWCSAQLAVTSACRRVKRCSWVLTAGSGKVSLPFPCMPRTSQRKNPAIPAGGIGARRVSSSALSAMRVNGGNARMRRLATQCRQWAQRLVCPRGCANQPEHGQRAGCTGQQSRRPALQPPQRQRATQGNGGPQQQWQPARQGRGQIPPAPASPHQSQP